MFKKLTLLFVFIVTTSVSSFLNAQMLHECGTSAKDLELIQQRLIANKKSLYSRNSTAASRSRETSYIPLKFHLVGRDNGTLRVESSKVFDQLCSMNETFEGSGIQFYIKDGFNYVNNSQIFDNGGNSTSLGTLGIMESVRDDDAVDIFIIRDAQDPTRTNVGFTLGVYFSNRDWIVVEQTEIRSGGMTLPHEIGHFFSLPHPFRGWDGEPYDPNIHGSPAPQFSPGRDFQGNLIPTEMVDGSNCETAGDMICDTRADYLYFSMIDNFNCVYREPLVDPSGDTLNVDSELIMSYFLDRCMNKFSPMQVQLMLEDYESEGRAHLMNNDIVTSGAIADEPAALLSPSNNITVSTSGLVDLEWTAVDGATEYYVELYSGTSGNNLALTATVSTPNTAVPVEIGGSYRWRIKPINGVNYCAPYSELRTFRTDLASSVSEVNSLESWTILPNPLLKNTSFVTVSLLANEAFNATVKVTDLSGGVIENLSNKDFNLGLNTVQIPLRNLGSGIYIVSIETELGISHQKLIVQQ